MGIDIENKQGFFRSQLARLSWAGGLGPGPCVEQLQTYSTCYVVVIVSSEQ